MANRGLDALKKTDNVAAEAAKKKKTNVFDTHGNDAIKDRVAEAKKTAGEPEQSNLLQSAEQETEAPSKEAAKADPAAERLATDELLVAFEKLKNSPERLAEVVGANKDRPSQVQALLEDLALELSMGARETMLLINTADVAKKLGNIVLSSESLKAGEQSVEVAMLGGMAPILYHLLSTELEQLPIVAASEQSGEKGGDRAKGESNPAAAALSVAMRGTSDFLLFLV